MDKLKVLVFMKPDKEIRLFLEQNFDCQIHEGTWGDPFPQLIKFITEDGRVAYTAEDYHVVDWIISWLAPWKIPKDILALAKNGAINFHPGPPKYPGIGCYNYAIWNQDAMYGVTCHFMNEKLDDGEIIEVRNVRMYETNTIESLKNRSMIVLKQLFYDQMNEILTTGNVHRIHEALKWGKYKSRKDFQEFCNITDFLDTDLEDEIKRRLRATYFKGARDGPYINLFDGRKWRLVPEEDL